MRCHECNYVMKKKPQRCPVCGEVLKADTISRFESVTDPNFTPPKYDLTPKPGMITPKELYIENPEQDKRRRGGIFDRFVDGIMGDLFEQDNPKDDPKYTALIDDFGNELSPQAVSGKHTTVEDFKEYIE